MVRYLWTKIQKHTNKDKLRVSVTLHSGNLNIPLPHLQLRAVLTRGEELMAIIGRMLQSKVRTS